MNVILTTSQTVEEYREQSDIIRNNEYGTTPNVIYNIFLVLPHWRSVTKYSI